MSNPLYLSQSDVEVIDLGARYCRTLLAVERAHALDDSGDVEAILGGIDPTEIRQVVDVLQALTLLWKVVNDEPVELHGYSKKVPCG